MGSTSSVSTTQVEEDEMLLKYGPLWQTSGGMQNVFECTEAPTQNQNRGCACPRVDIEERADKFVMAVELPGVSKEDVKITLESNILTIKGEKRQQQVQKGRNYHRLERSYGSFQRSFTLPTTIRNDRIDASFQDGVLSIALPKSEEAKPRTIEVKVR